MAKKNKPAPSTGLTLTAPALLFAGGMLVLGAVGGYMVGKAQGIVEGGDSSGAGAETAGATEPRGKVVNKTGGELRRLSEDEEEALSDNKSRGTVKIPGPPRRLPVQPRTSCLGLRTARSGRTTSVRSPT